MTHKMAGVDITFGCYHPQMQNNTCPTKSGDCSTCPHCKATMSAADALELVHKVEANKVTASIRR